MTTDAISTEAIRISGANGDEIEAYLARPSGDQPHSGAAAPRGGVVLIHHLPGFDRWTKEVARRFATDGYDVIAPNLFWRNAPGADPDDAAAAARAQRGVPDAQVVGDVRAGVDYLRALPSSNGKVAVIGHCSGGRHAVLAGCHLDVQGVVDCYGAFVTGEPPADFPIAVTNLVDQLDGLSAPVLGLFGRDDSHPSPADVAQFDELLTAGGVRHEFTSYDGAGHAFFSTDRPSYRVEASVDGYQRIGQFFAETIG